jgi:uncharacterized protein (DUF2147 family)
MTSMPIDLMGPDKGPAARRGPKRQKPPSANLRRLARLLGATLLTAATILFWVPPATAQLAVPQGVWLIDQKAAVQIFDCNERMCGRIVWLAKPRNALGQLDRDKNNPDLTLRERPLCGLTILWALRPDGPDRWKDGWFYNPDDGQTYRVSAQLKSDDVMVARIYAWIPVFGTTKTLARVPKDITDGWC